MKQMRLGLIAFGMMLCIVTSAAAEVNISIGLPRVSIGINLPLLKWSGLARQPEV